MEGGELDDVCVGERELEWYRITPGDRWSEGEAPPSSLAEQRDDNSAAEGEPA